MWMENTLPGKGQHRAGLAVWDDHPLAQRGCPEYPSTPHPQNQSLAGRGRSGSFI